MNVVDVLYIFITNRTMKPFKWGEGIRKNYSEDAPNQGTLQAYMEISQGNPSYTTNIC
jgi:hypothetical protein